MSNELKSTPPPEIIPDQSLWYKGRDGKFYATQEGLRRAVEKYLIKKNPKKEKLLNNPNKNQLLEVISPEETKLAKKILPDELRELLSNIPADQLRTLADFLASLHPPPTTSTDQKQF